MKGRTESMLCCNKWGFNKMTSKVWSHTIPSSQENPYYINSLNSGILINYWRSLWKIGCTDKWRSFTEAEISHTCLRNYKKWWLCKTTPFRTYMVKLIIGNAAETVDWHTEQTMNVVHVQGSCRSQEEISADAELHQDAGDLSSATLNCSQMRSFLLLWVRGYESTTLCHHKRSHNTYWRERSHQE